LVKLFTRNKIVLRKKLQEGKCGWHSKSKGEGGVSRLEKQTVASKSATGCSEHSKA
jgi:hypothetical protein